MIRCFLSYSYSYRETMLLVKSMLEVLDFEVFVFDHPDPRPAWDVVLTEIEKADCVVVLLGPDFRDGSPVAQWPSEEVVAANSLRKPIALVVHPGTPVPHLADHMQTPPQFDFEKLDSYGRNAHHVVKHLMDTRRRLEGPPGGASYYVSRAAIRFHFDRGLSTVREHVFHEVVAREPWSMIHHSIDTGLDRTASAHLTLTAPIEWETVDGQALYNTEFELGTKTRYAQPYVVHIQPQLPAGGRVSYRRIFSFENYFPVRADALLARSAEKGFPEVFRLQHKLYYGQSFDVTGEMETLSFSYTFPGGSGGVEIGHTRAVALVTNTQAVNTQETERINASDMLGKNLDKDRGETTVELEVRKPLAGHSYVLMYEPL